MQNQHSKIFRDSGLPVTLDAPSQAEHSPVATNVVARSTQRFEVGQKVEAVDDCPPWFRAGDIVVVHSFSEKGNLYISGSVMREGPFYLSRFKPLKEPRVQGQKSTYEVKVLYFKASGKLYAEGRGVFAATVCSGGSAYMDDVVEEFVRLRKTCGQMPGLIGCWKGPIVLLCEDGHPVMLPAHTEEG